jgi:hypothetical protein
MLVYQLSAAAITRAIYVRRNARLLGGCDIRRHGSNSRHHHSRRVRGEVMSAVPVAMNACLPDSALGDLIFAHRTMAEGLNDLLA